MQAEPQQRVLVLSALSDVATKVRCLELGAADYLAKPFALAELVARVWARMRDPTGSQEAGLIRAGSVTLDSQRRTVDLGAGPIDLSSREFLLLKHLATHGGVVCTRAELLAEVWGYSFDPGTNVVDVCIRRLRTKLGRDVIETVRHAGYRIRTLRAVA
jgi:DNA-binding response OmpR family regulator